MQAPRDDTMKIGPPGPCQGSGRWNWDHKGRSQVVQILVWFGPKYLESLRFRYVENGELVTSEIIGCQDFKEAANFETLTLDYPSEYITAVSGRYINAWNDRQLRFTSYIEELTILTNWSPSVTGKTFKPHSHQSEKAELFKFVLGRPNQFGGFHGVHNADCVESIGVYVSPITALPKWTMKRKLPPTPQAEDEP